MQLYGEWVEFPICVAPTAMQRMAHSEGEGATARGTQGATIPDPSLLLHNYYCMNIEKSGVAWGRGYGRQIIINKDV